MITRIRVALQPSESGVTLPELIVAMLVSILVLGVAGILFSTTTKATGSAISRSQTTSSAQSTASSIEQGMRNSSEFTVLTNGADQLLVARVAGTASTITWRCVGWYYSASNKTIRLTTTADGTKIGIPTAAQLATWTLLASGISQSGSLPVFTAYSLTQLNLSFVAASPNNMPVSIQTSVVQTTGVAKAGTCF